MAHTVREYMYVCGVDLVCFKGISPYIEWNEFRKVTKKEKSTK